MPLAQRPSPARLTVCFYFCLFSFRFPREAGAGTRSESVAQAAALKHSEETYAVREEQLHLDMLQRMQGLHAPMRLLMERKAASPVTRLPFLPSSRLMHDVLTARDEDIGPEHMFNDPQEPEVMGTPLLVMQRSLGLL